MNIQSSIENIQSIQARNPNPATRNPKPDTRNLHPATRNPSNSILNSLKAYAIRYQHLCRHQVLNKRWCEYRYLSFLTR